MTEEWSVETALYPTCGLVAKQPAPGPSGRMKTPAYRTRGDELYAAGPVEEEIANWRSNEMEMASLKTLCQIYDWKYDTIYKKWKRGEFVKGYKDPVGRGIRFDLKEVAVWAHQKPVEIPRASLSVNEI